jgi:hypothetical protein
VTIVSEYLKHVYMVTKYDNSNSGSLYQNRIIIFYMTFSPPSKTKKTHVFYHVTNLQSPLECGIPHPTRTPASRCRNTFTFSCFDIYVRPGPGNKPGSAQIVQPPLQSNNPSQKGHFNTNILIMVFLSSNELCNFEFLS